jgi:hypothetical protein
MRSCQHGRTETSCPDCARIHLGINKNPVTAHDIPDALRNQHNLVAELRGQIADLNTRNADLVEALETCMLVDEGGTQLTQLFNIPMVQKALRNNQSSSDKWKREIEAKVLEEAMNNERITQTSKEELRRMAADRRAG